MVAGRVASIGWGVSLRLLESQRPITSFMARSAGVLLHITSLPGPFDSGDLGPSADRFLDWLAEVGFSWWQVLPLNPPGYGGSPYQAWSAFAGNPELVSPELLEEEGLLERRPPGDRTTRSELLRRAFRNFEPDEEYDRFVEGGEEWLDDAVLFRVLHDRNPTGWTTWDPHLRDRDRQALQRVREEEEELAYHRFVQYQFFRQIERLRKRARERGIGLIGDIPIFVAHDSADVWAHRDLYELDESGAPTSVAGVPPDYFSPTGQRWGNPLYRWDVMREDRYRWWVERIRTALRLYDAIRLDHFRGFESYWKIPATEPDAVQGLWASGPREDLFDSLVEQLGPLPLLAEDLGDITPEVDELRRRVGLPGMAVLQFGPSDPMSPHLPHNFGDSSRVVYTGTHDNDTTIGWWRALSKEDRAFLRSYLGQPKLGARRVADVAVAMRRMAFRSTAEGAIIPMQDLLLLGSESRMNRPGRLTGKNWSWRMEPDGLDRVDGKGLREELRVTARLPKPRP